MPIVNKSNKKIVFIVEDDVFLVKAYEIKFIKEGADVWIAHDGQEALDFLKKDPPSIVMLDLMLPIISGFEVLTAIRKSETWKNVPVIVLSNLGQSEDMKKCQELGIEEYIVKANIKIKDIIEKVNKYIA